MKIFSNLLSTFFLVFFLSYLFQNPDTFDILFNIAYSHIVLLVLIKFLTLLLNAFFNKKIVEAFNVDLGRLESLYIGSITYLGNLFLPGRLGGSLRLVYFKKIYKIKTFYLVSIFGYFFVVSLFINSIFGILSLVFIGTATSYVSVIWFFLFGILFFITLYLLIKKFQINATNTNIKFLNKIFSSLQSSKEGWNKITKFPGLNFKLISIYFLNYLLFLLEIYLIFMFVGGFLQIENVIFYNSISVFSGLVGITPGALGIKETLLLISYELLNINSQKLIEVILIERVISIIFTIIPLALSTIFNKINK